MSAPEPARVEKKAREHCREEIRRAIQKEENILLGEVGAVGKSKQAATLANNTDFPVTYFTHRNELREQAEDWAAELGLSVIQLPRFSEDCPAYRTNDKVSDLHDRGVTPSTIHSELSICSEGCPYQDKWDEVSEQDWDLIIGHPSYAQNPKTLGVHSESRVAVFDEDPRESFQEKFKYSDVKRIAKAFLSDHDEIPANNIQELRALRAEETDLTDFDCIGSEDTRDESDPIEDEDSDARAKAIVRTLVEGEDLGNGFERVELGDKTVAVYDRESGGIRLRTQPDLEYARRVIVLDGAPIKHIWENKLGVELHNRRILTNEDRKKWVRDVLRLNIVQTTENDYPLSGDNIEEQKRQKFFALIDQISAKHKENLSLITTKKARENLGLNHDDPEYIDDILHYNKQKGSNKLSDADLGVILGCPYPGDKEIQWLAALDGIGIEADRDNNRLQGFIQVGGKEGIDPDEYLHHFRECKVQHAIFRFGRDKQGATVYVHTDAIPEWLVESKCEAVELLNDTRWAVIQALSDLEEAKRSEIIGWIESNLNDPPDVGGEAYRRHLKSFEEDGLVRREGHTWINHGLEKIEGPVLVDLPTLE